MHLRRPGKQQPGSPTPIGKLTELEYTVPAMAGAAVDALARGRPGRPFASALDAGCGTGLAGPHLRRHVSGPLVGEI